MSQNTDVTDKIILNPQDADGFAEHFSRLNPGDTVRFSGKATLDEAGQKTIVLSISEFEIHPEGSDEEEAAESTKEEDKEGAEGEASEESAAVKMMKNEEGIPSQEGAENVPDVIPSH